MKKLIFLIFVLANLNKSGYCTAQGAGIILFLNFYQLINCIDNQ